VGERTGQRVSPSLTILPLPVRYSYAKRTASLQPAPPQGLSVDFIPLRTERFDFVMAPETRTACDAAPKLEVLAGSKTEQTGTVFA
jgi:hypothetical protein